MRNNNKLIIKTNYYFHMIFLALLLLLPGYVYAQDHEGHTHANGNRTIPANRLWCNEHNVYEDECFICHPELATKNNNEKSDERLWCSEHGVYEDECVICNPDLTKKEHDHRTIPTNRLWCNEHNVYEDECFICHPELATKNNNEKSDERLWCSEHGVYEDECVICNPNLTKKEHDHSGGKGHDHNSEGIYCNEHRLEESECGICHPELAKSLEPGKGLKVRLASLNSATKAGVSTMFPEEGKPFAGPSVLCEATYNQNRLARITPLTSGVIRKVFVDVGDYVSQDDILVEIASPQIAKAKAEYLTALANKAFKDLHYEREKGLLEKNISSQHEYQNALAERQMAINSTNTKHQQLLNFGFTETEVQEIVETQSSSSTLRIRAPFEGTIIERNAVIGEATNTGDSIFSLTDLSTMWLELSIPEGSFTFFNVGNAIEADFKSLSGRKIKGQLIWISSNIEADSRMMKARAIVNNHDSLLKQGMFGKVYLVPSSEKGLYVPPDSIQRFDGDNFIFVMLSEDLFELRKVALGNKNSAKVEIVKGISAQDKVVVNGSFTLKSEFLQSRMGKGCSHD